MFCASCSKISLSALCSKCLENFTLLENEGIRILENNLKVISIFPYSELREFIMSKHNIIGSRIFKSIAKYAVEKLNEYLELMNFNKTVIAIFYIAEFKLDSYSHTAIIAHAFKKYGFKVIPIFPSKNIKYSSLNRKERKLSSRGFKIYNFKFDGGIIIDDIITTGYTMMQASNILSFHRINPLIGFTLCDSRF